MYQLELGQVEVDSSKGSEMQRYAIAPEKTVCGEIGLWLEGS
jgi:hypothetical protein